MFFYKLLMTEEPDDLKVTSGSVGRTAEQSAALTRNTECLFTGDGWLKGFKGGVIIDLSFDIGVRLFVSQRYNIRDQKEYVLFYDTYWISK